jgi:hypothetical protein
MTKWPGHVATRRKTDARLGAIKRAAHNMKMKGMMRMKTRLMKTSHCRDQRWSL